MTKSNVVPIQQSTPVERKPTSLAFTIDQLDSYHGRRKIASLMRQWHMRMPRKQHTWTAFAKRAGVSEKTISKIASEDTKAPRLHTILMILRALGFAFVRFDSE